MGRGLGRVLHVTYDAAGNVPPMAALAAAFVSRGHDVVDDATLVDVWLADVSPLVSAPANATRERLGVPACQSWADVPVGHSGVIGDPSFRDAAERISHEARQAGGARAAV